jgi:hypothetical protein
MNKYKAYEQRFKITGVATENKNVTHQVTRIIRNQTALNLIFSRIDSIMLLEEGFKVTSVDASDKMLKYALKTRWNRRKEEAFDAWGK